MAKLKNILGSMVVFYVLIVLVVNFWGGFRVSYNVEDTEENLQGGLTIFEKLQSLNLIQGINGLKSGIEKLTSIGSADFDILGGLATSSVGVLQTVGGVITFPLDIFSVISGPNGYYKTLVPEIVSTLIGLTVVLAIAVLLISAKLGFDLT